MLWLMLLCPACCSTGDFRRKISSTLEQGWQIIAFKCGQGGENKGFGLKTFLFLFVPYSPKSKVFHEGAMW